jgi:hypothetical protein
MTNRMLGSRYRVARIGVLTAAALTLLVAPAAQADVFTSTFDSSNIFPAATAQNYGTLGVSCNGTTCTVTLNPASGVTFFDTNFVDFNLAATAGTITLSSAITAAGGTLTTGSFNNDGFGLFQHQINLPDGPNSGFSSSVTLFTVSFTGAANTLLVNNTDGFDASGHVSAPNLVSCTFKVGESANGTKQDGSLSNGDSTCAAVPEPGTLTLLGTGLITVASLFRLRFNRGRRETA